MEESICSFVLEKLSWVFEQKEKLFGGGQDEFDSLNSDLKLAYAFINESRGKHNEHELLTEARRQLRDIAYEAEDVMDALKVEDLRRRNLVWKIIRYPMMCHDAAKKIEGFNHKINKILDTVQRYEAEATPVAAVDVALERHRRVVKEKDVVGFAIDSTKLEKQLMEGDSKLGVISIIGMGGSGKTTLAWKIYNTLLVEGHFVCRIWVHASYQFRTRDLLLEMLKFEIPESDESINGALEDSKRIKRRRMKEIGDMSEDELKEKLSKYLEGKRYLVVMDNIWPTEGWNELIAAFPDNSNGSRILITSRIKRVASGISLSTSHFPPILDEDESWELFRKKVFIREKFLPQLETLGRQIAKSCEGLPLSIVELGGLAAVEEKLTHLTLSKYVGNVNSYLCSKTRCKDILSLSYTHLSQDLKSCFFYFGVYPEEFEIPVRQLVQLWIAEGFIPHTGSRNIEDVAEDYFDELCDQSLIQVASSRTYRGAKTCRIHALLRQISICEGKEEKFLEVFRHVNLLSENKSRRVSVQYCSTPHYISSNLFRATRARSLLFFRQKEFSFDSSNKKKQTYGDLDPNHWKWVHENFCLVRVLHFGQLNIYSIPSNIEELICLRYLRIKSDVLKVIPTSICNLKHLETLDLKGTFLNCLPIGIWNLRNLRNLYMSGPVSLPNQLNPDVKALWKLQVLSTVSLNPQNVSLIVQSELLRKIGIWFASDDSNCRAVEVLAELHDLPHLQTLKVVNCSEGLRLPTSFPSTITKITLRQIRSLVLKFLNWKN
ncbi:putative disease resistance RPP13-like protein 3 [Juglans regia]|uniref:Disease resistance RPP13-like protein 3 n=1 Tax=Juglans regia TaxID=51240 RepID=A0A6P9DT20_JUGRE|nr:putative disease resistance RPP13-like protein 3 [Juglans regia]